MIIDKKHYSFQLNDLEICAKEVSALMGYKKSNVPVEMLQMIEAELENMANAKGIEVGYVYYKGDLDPGSHTLTIGSTSFDLGEAIALRFKHSEYIAIFAGTAGETISNRSKELMEKGDVLEGYIVDVIGSMVVEKATDKVHYTYMKNDFQKKGLKLTNRYSPGYISWNINEQHKLFSLLPKEFCNVSLTPSSLMLPIKSVSGFVGVGKQVQFQKYTCDACTQTDCLYRCRKKVVKSLD